MVLPTRWSIEEVHVKLYDDLKSRGFGIATFATVSALEDCLSRGPHWVDGKQVTKGVVITDVMLVKYIFTLGSDA